MAARRGLFTWSLTWLAVVLTSPIVDAVASCSNDDTSANAGPPPGKKELMAAWTSFMAEDKGNVTLLAFDGTILERTDNEKSLRRLLSPLHLHRGAVMRYVSASGWQTFSEDPLDPWGIVQIAGSIEGTMADHEGPHLLTANLHNLFMKVSWEPCGNYTLCLVTAGYVKNLMTDENYVRWGQDVEALVAGASVTALVTQLYQLAERLPGWKYCPDLTSDKGELSGFGYL